MRYLLKMGIKIIRGVVQVLLWIANTLLDTVAPRTDKEQHYQEGTDEQPAMHMAKITPAPTDGDYSRWCPFDVMQYGEYLPVKGFLGECSECHQLGYPEWIWAAFVRNDGNYHVMWPIFEYHCKYCGSLMKAFGLLCNSKPIEVSQEFMENRK